MGCYDSRLLRPLLGRRIRTNNNHELNINNPNHNGHSSSSHSAPLPFWTRLRHRLAGRRSSSRYHDMDGDEDDEVNSRHKSKNSRASGSIMGALHKIRLLIWKNLLLRKRHYLVTTFEILLPTLFALILVYGRSKADRTHAGGGSATSGLSGALAFLKNIPVVYDEFGEDALPIGCGSFQYKEECIIAYAPNTTEMRDDVISHLQKYVHTPSSQIEWKGFDSEKEVDKFLTSLKFNEVTGRSETLRGAIIFPHGLQAKEGKIVYKIRMMDTSGFFPSEVISSIYPPLQLPGPDESNRVRYAGSGFTAIQLRLDQALVKKFTGKAPDHLYAMQPFPYPPYERTMNFSEFYFIILPSVIILGFIFIVPSIVRGVVNERETGIKELMKLCGLSNWMHWFAWAINSLLFLSLSVTIVVFLLFTDILNKDAGPIFSRSDPLVWWVTLVLYVMSAITFCFFISSFFTRPTIAITVGIILWLVTFYAPSVSLGDNNKYINLTLFNKLTVSLLPNMALYWALKVMCGFEAKATGAQWSNLFEPLSSTDSLTLGHMYFMFIFNFVFYFLLTLYVEAVIPSPYGIRKPWYFIFKPSKWSLRSTSKSSECEMKSNGHSPSGSTAAFEPEPSGRKAGVVMKNLKKKFGPGKMAVDGVSMKMYDGEIFALLGHNGAGKTTTISCCIGMMAPSSGSVFINGVNIGSDLDEARTYLGVCPQHNLIFDELTVDEHLTFFGRLKGLNASEAKKERVVMLEKLQLTEKMNTLGQNLSGGQKRKLCLGISLIGKAKVVFLDEPTSGMDVEARRAIWDLLLGERGQRTIVLTTHFMEEADVLGDRIGIMAHGQVQCCGTSLFLKKFYGTGYTLALTLSKKDDSTTSEDSKKSILAIVKNYVPSASVQNDAIDKPSNEFSITLPTTTDSTVGTALFPKMFEELEENKHSLGIRTIGLSHITMDEVFIKVDQGAHHEDQPDHAVVQDISNRSNPSEGTLLNNRHQQHGAVQEEPKMIESMKQRLRGLRLIRQQFWGLFLKRVIYTRRKWKLMLTQVSIPVLILIVAILTGNMQLQPPKSKKPLVIGLGSYKDPITLYSTTDTELGINFARTVGSSAGQFGGKEDLLVELIRRGHDDLAVFRERHIIAASINSTHAKALYSTIPYHTAPLALNAITNTFLASAQPPVKVQVVNHPLQAGYEYLLQAVENDPAFSVANALMFGALVPIGLALLAASFIVSPVEERLCKGKRLQLMTGVHPALYWGASLAWDFLIVITVVLAMVFCFLMFEKGSVYTSHGGAGAIFLILLIYGYAAIPFSYICSIFVGTVPGGFSLVTIVHIITGMILPFVVYIMESLPLASITDTVRIVGRFFPTFGASLSTMRFVEIGLKNGRCSLLPDNAQDFLCDPKIALEPKLRTCCSNCHEFEGAQCMTPIDYLTWTFKREAIVVIPGGGQEDGVPGIGQELIFMCLLALLYQFILILMELGLFERMAALVFRTETEAFSNTTDDDDVEVEASRVHSLVQQKNVGEDAIVVEDMCKSYGSLAAVANLNFGVHHGECFGLLGVNGAGKTTTFRMLTGDEIRSNGNAFASGFNLESSRKQFLGNIGYCPQFDGIVPVLTGREMVALFARLRGVENVSKECENWLSKVGLMGSGDVQSRKYSGGMKRRLSAAMAMVGDPLILFLDEPTSGVDPVSRREFWKIISSIRESGRAIILTSHSMEEITACCSRLGIMVNGQLQCLGSVQHLKRKFAQGYTLTVKLKSTAVLNQDQLQKLQTDISSRLAPCTLKDKHQTAMQFHIENTSLPWYILFGTMEALKSEYSEFNLIEDYSVTETTLEEVFLAFARKQYANREANVSFLKKLVTCQCCQ